jgi:hypothetical protein
MAGRIGQGLISSEKNITETYNRSSCLTCRAYREEKKIYSAMGSCIDKAAVATQVERVREDSENDGASPAGFPEP